MVDNDRLRNVISWLRENKIITTQEDLAAKIGTSRTYISHLTTGRRCMTPRMAKRICGLSERLNINYLLDERETSMTFPDDESSSINELFGVYNKMKMKQSKHLTLLDRPNSYLFVPVYNFDAVGGMNAANDITDAPAYIEKYVPFVGAHDGDICVHVTGNSMIPTYSPGTMLLIRKVDGWKEFFGYGHTFVLFLNDGRRILKEVRRYAENPKDYVLCVSHNKEYEDEELPKSMIVSVYKVIMALTNDGF